MGSVPLDQDIRDEGRAAGIRRPTRAVRWIALPQPRSEWPVSLLLDESWLSARRALVRRLESEGLWPDSEEIAQHRRRRAARGDQLRESVLRTVLGAADRRLAESGAGFGPLSDDLWEKASRALAFGYEIGGLFHALAARTGPVDEAPVDGAAQRAARSCAVFNFGIALFDLVQDEAPDQDVVFSAVLDAGTLSHALDAPEQADRLDAGIAGLPTLELRLLGGLVTAFVRGVHAVHPGPEALRSLADVILAAYAAERASGGADEDAAAVSRAKSTLPFRAMLEVAALETDATPGTPDMRSVSDAVGVVFWLVDDLVDLVRDFRDGALNSLLLSGADAVQRGVGAVGDEYAVLEETLTGGHIERAVEAVVTALADLRAGVSRLCCGEDIADAAVRLVCHHIRFWLE